MRAVVRSPDGAVTVDMEVEPDSTVGNLKELCSKHWRFPAIFQKLFIGDAAVRDADQLQSLLPADAKELAVTLVLTLSCLEDDDDQTRLGALEALGEMGKREQRGEAESEERAFAAVSLSLQDPDPPTRRLAMRVLCDISEQGDQRVVSTACTVLRDPDPQVVCVALEVLAKFAKPGESQATEAVIACLQHAPLEHGEDVSFASLRALGSLAQKGEKRCSTTLGQCLDDGNSYIRLMALDLLAVVAEKGDEAALAAIQTRFQDSDGSIKQKALECFASLVPEKGEEKAVAAVVGCLQDGSARVRCAALIALESVALKGGAEAVSAVCRCVADDKADVRCVALEVLGKLAEPGDAEATWAARSRLEPEEDPDIDVREMAEETLAILVPS